MMTAATILKNLAINSYIRELEDERVMWEAYLNSPEFQGFRWNPPTPFQPKSSVCKECGARI
jgi:hypothetical protein